MLIKGVDHLLCIILKEKISNLVGFALVDRAIGLYTPCIFQVHINSKHLEDKLHFERL